MRKIRVGKTFMFSAAHCLPNHPGRCSSYHGHNYHVEIEVQGPVDKDTGMVCDFGDLKKTIGFFLDTVFDHTNLNDTIKIPTAENLVEYLISKKDVLLPNPHMLLLSRVRVYETDGCYAEWRNEDGR